MSKNRKRRRLLKLRREDVRTVTLTTWSKWPPISPALHLRAGQVPVRRQWWPSKHPRGMERELYYKAPDGVSRKTPADAS
jgi:hypothetical protein